MDSSSKKLLIVKKKKPFVKKIHNENNQGVPGIPPVPGQFKPTVIPGLMQTKVVPGLIHPKVVPKIQPKVSQGTVGSQVLKVPQGSGSSHGHKLIDLYHDNHDYDLSNDNAKIIEQFNLLVTQIENQILYEKDPKEKSKHGFRLTNIKKAITIFENYPGKIPNGREAQKIKGIGKGIGNRIDEILQTGTLKELTDKKYVEEFLNTMKELCQVTGIGQARARLLIDDFKVKGVQDLQEKYAKGEIKVTKNQLTHHMVVGLKYYDDIMQKIPHEEIIQMESLLQSTVKDVDPLLILTVCGSFRRKRPLSGDIDVLVTHPQLKTAEDIKACSRKYLPDLVSHLSKSKFLVDHLTDKGQTKYMGVCKLPSLQNGPGRRIDIRFLPYESFGAGLLYFTGSGHFNKIFRGIALQKGYTVSEYGIYYLVNGKKGSMIPTYSEQEIFDLVGIKYLEPTQRDF